MINFIDNCTFLRHIDRMDSFGAPFGVKPNQTFYFQTPCQTTAWYVSSPKHNQINFQKIPKLKGKSR